MTVVAGGTTIRCAKDATFGTQALSIIEVETLSRMYVQALTLGEPPILPDEEMERVIEQMRRMSYGLAPDAEGVNDVARPRNAS
jgi:L-fuculose-phosphate aldolase